MTDLVNLIRTEGSVGAGGLASLSIMLTPEYARLMLDNNEFNRDVDKSVVDKMVREIEAGQWYANGSSMSITADTHRTSDGQHRCHAVLITGIAIPVVLVVGVADNRAVIGSIDQGKVRTVADILKITERVSLPPNVSTVATLLSQLIENTGVRINDRPAQAAFARRYGETLAPWTQWAYNLATTSARANGISRGRSVQGSSLAVLGWHMSERGADPETVMEFFQGVINPLNLSPRTIQEMTENRRGTLEALHRRTLNYPLARQGGGKSFGHLMMEYAVHIIAYNRYIADYPVQYFRPFKQSFRWLSELPAPSRGTLWSPTGETMISETIPARAEAVLS